MADSHSSRKVTVAEALEAMAQNNIPFLAGGLTNSSEYQKIGGSRLILSACALGQCAINLGVTPSSLEVAFRGIMLEGGHSSLTSAVIEQNDTFRVAPDVAAARVRAKLTEAQLAQKIEVLTEFSVVVLKAS